MMINFGIILIMIVIMIYTISHLKMDNIAKYFYLIFVKNEGNMPIFPEAFCEYQIKR
jgi:hypothetical protein